MKRIVSLQKSGITENELYELYNLYNDKYFNSSLPNASLNNDDIKIYIVNNKAKYYGRCSKEGVIEINAYNLNDAYKIEVINTLLHEMIHTMQFSLGYSSGHGVSFKEKAAEINKDGWNIKVHVDEKLTKLIYNIEDICKYKEEVFDRLNKLEYRIQTSTIYYVNLIKEILEYNNIDYSDNDISELQKNINNNKYMEDELNEIIDIISNDDNINESDWTLFKKWKDNEAIWNLDKEGEKTKLTDCFANIVGFIENFPTTKGKIKFNVIRNIVEFNDNPVTDNDYHTVINLINKYFIPTFSKIKMVKEAMDNVANKYKYNPWVEYFDSLEYNDDGIDYIDYVIREVLCCRELDKYYDLYYESIKITLLASMKRIYCRDKNIKVKFDSVLTFASVNQGTGKTTFPDRLFDLNDDKGDSYCYIVAGDSFQPKDKDFLERTHQCTCLLLDEITMKRSIVTSVKGYITQKDDRFRKSFGYNNEAHMRVFVIMATTNNTDILKDYTTDNERRWLIIMVTEDTNNYKKVNEAFNNGLRDKIWAFIKHIYDTEDYNLYLTDERLIRLEGEIQRNYKASNNVDYNTIIDDLLERKYGFVCVKDETIIDTDFIVEQYRYGDSLEWCRRHNEELDGKIKLAAEGKYTLSPKDKRITKYGKIDRISKNQLYNILSKLQFDFTKMSLNAEMRYSGKWKGWLKGNNACRINHRLVNAYWRTQPESCNDIVNINGSLF